MSKKSAPLHKQIQWRLECLILRVAEVIAARLPGSWVFHAGEAFGGGLWYLLLKRRKVTIRNLRIAYGEQKSLEEIQGMAKASFRRAGGNLLSGTHTASLSPSQLQEVIRVENQELLQESIDAGRGVVMLLAHMGNWELLSRMTHFLPEGVKTGAMYRPLNNVFMDERVRTLREADGTQMFSKRDPFHRITGFLREGGLVGVLADQRVGNNGDLIRFFGRLTKASPLPSLLARRANCDVIALSMVTEGPGKWRAKLLPVESPASTENCMAALESAMKMSFKDVFWLQDRWRMRLSPRFMPPEIFSDERSEPGKKHRALIWLVGQKPPAQLKTRWLHDDVEYELAIEPGRPLPDWSPEGVVVHRIELPFGIAATARAIGQIDSLEVRPLDFVMAPDLPKELRKACKSECIPAYLHDLGG